MMINQTLYARYLGSHGLNGLLMGSEITLSHAMTLPFDYLSLQIDHM